MKKQKIAVFLSSLMMLSILVPAIVSAQVKEADQTGSVDITGTSDLFYEGYNPSEGSNPDTLVFTPISSSSSNQTVRISDQKATPANVTFGSWHKKQFIGAMILEDIDGFSITVSGDGVFTDKNNANKKFDAANFGVVTGVGLPFQPTDGGPDVTTISCATAQCQYDLLTSVDDSAKKVIYYLEAEGYTYDEDHFEAPNNITSSYNPETYDYYTDKNIVSDDVTLLEAKEEGVLGIFGIGFDYKLEIPGATPNGGYTTTITYDFATDTITTP